MQRDVHRHQQLAGLVVKSFGDALGFLFEHLIEVAQRRIGFAKSAIGHLIRRDAFGEKLRRTRHDAIAFIRRRLSGEQLAQADMVNVRNRDQARACLQGMATDLIGLLQRRFPAPPR